MNRNSKNAAAIRDSGHRLTLQRLMVLDAIGDLGGHVTVDEILGRVHQRYAFIDLATVYRTVALLSRLHLVNEVQFGSVSHYETTDPHKRHHHVVCEHCGQVFHLDPQYLDRLKAELLNDIGFEPHMEHFTVSGLCAECRRNQAHSHSGHTHASGRGVGHRHQIATV